MRIESKKDLVTILSFDEHEMFHLEDEIRRAISYIPDCDDETDTLELLTKIRNHLLKHFRERVV